MGVGDEILAAGQAQVLFEENGRRPVFVVDANGRPRWHFIWDGNPAILRPGATPEGVAQCVENYPGHRPYFRSFSTEQGWVWEPTWRARDHVARIYLTASERAAGAQARRELGRFVLIEPYSKHLNLQWPLAYWQELVARCRDLTFVQHTHADTKGLVVRGARTFYTNDFRAACGLLTGAALYIRGESGMCHAAAALDVPNVVIWGGCMSWAQLGGYPKQLGLVDRGEGSPCGNWKPCEHCRIAMARFTPDVVELTLRDALERWPASSEAA